MSFEDRIKKAIQRGEKRRDARVAEARAEALNLDEIKRLHSKYRLQLSEHIETCVEQLTGHFPGFKFETIFGDRGWGAACSRDDLRLQAGRRNNDYSRLEITVRPFSDLHVVDLAGKGTIRNKEVYNRNYFEKVEDVDVDKFVELIDVWILEYAELYAAK